MPHLDKFYRRVGYAAHGSGIENGATPVAPAVSVTGVSEKATASALGLCALAAKDVILIYGVPGEPAGQHTQDSMLARTLIAALG